MLSGMVSKAMGLLYHEVWPAQDGLPDHSQELSLGAWRIDANYDQCENTAQQLFPFPSLTRSVFLDCELGAGWIGSDGNYVVGPLIDLDLPQGLCSTAAHSH
jgi:hypothetical protein